MLNNSFTSFACAGNTNYVGRQGSSSHFPLPWLDYTSTSVPRNFSELIDWSEYMMTMSDIREIYRRMFNYFATDIEIAAVDSTKQPLSTRDEKNWIKLFNTKLGWQVHAVSMLDNISTYGNDFISVIAGKRRFLQCPTCGQKLELEYLSKQTGSDFAYRDGNFVARCQSVVCRRRRDGVQRMIVRDVDLTDPETVTIKHWPVREIALNYYMYTDETDVFWRIPETYKKQVAQGDPRTLATADLGVLDAIRKNTYFQFRKDRIFHAKEPTLSGIMTRGWGLPRTIQMARQAWSLQMIRKQIQALGIDFIVPMRILTPSTQSSSAGMGGIDLNPNAMLGANEFARIVARLRAAHRSDPTQVHALQVPTDYRVIGGEANQLFPIDYQQSAKEDLLDAVGVPVNFYKADLTLQTAPVGLRLFESINRSVPWMINRAVDFVAGRLSEISQWDPVEASHKRVTLVDNIENTMAKLQLASGGQLSMGAALEPIGEDFEDDIRRQAREQQIMMDIQTEQQERMQKEQESMALMQQNTAAAGGAPPAGGGAPPAGDPAAVPGMGPMLPSQGFLPPQDIQGMEGAATGLAEQLSMMDNASRQNELKVLREQHPTFHALVMQRLDDVRYQQQVQGRQMMMGGGGMPM